MVLKTKSLFCALIASAVVQNFAFAGYPGQYKGAVKILRPCPNGSSCDGAYGWADGDEAFGNNNITTLGGSVGAEVYKGTFGDKDEGAVVLLTMVDKVGADGDGRGIKVRPVQFQAGNEDNTGYTWIRLMDSGTKAANFYNKLQKGCDNTNYKDYFGGAFLMTSGGNRPERFEVYGTYSNGIQNGLTTYSRMDVFAVRKILEHGVYMTVVKLYADTDMSWSKRYSGIEMMKKSKGDGALFCAAGYKPSGGDCVKEDAAGYCQTPPEDKLCSGYDKAWYLGHRNQLIIPADMKSGSNCYQYYCRDERMGFRSATDHTCVQCDEVRSGRAADGTCFATCDYGQSYRVADYYKDGQCKKDVEYTKNDMMYGKGKTENSSTFDTACWPKREAALYRQCVPQGGGKTLIFRNILNLEVKQILQTSNAVNASVVLK